MSEVAREIVSAAAAIEEFSLPWNDQTDEEYKRSVEHVIATHIAPLIARERVAVLRECVAKLRSPETASYNDLVCSAKLIEMADVEEARAGGGGA